MRLNRVLLLAATINILIFALAFTISCSGEDGKAGRNGDICTVEQNGEVWDVYCNDNLGNDNLVGVLKNNDTGEPGAPGAPGDPGDPGADGTECHLSGLNILCNGVSKGSLETCLVAVDPTNRQHITVSCGASTIEICEGLDTDKSASSSVATNYGTKLFDAKKYACSEEGALVLAKNFEDICPDGKAYDKRKEYCGMGTGTDSTKYPKQTFCGANLGLKGPKYMLNVASVVSSGGAIVDLTWCKKQAELNNVTTYYWDGSKCWQNSNKGEYCRYSIVNKGDSTSLKLDTIAFVDTTVCGDGKKPNSAGKYNREYCGFSSGANKTSLQKDACDDYFTHQFKDPGDPLDSAYYITTVSAGDPRLVAPATLPFARKMRNFGPNEKAFATAYCEVTAANKDKTPVKTETSNNFCVVQEVDISAVQTSTSPTFKTDSAQYYRVAVNQNTWKDQYCGYKDTANVAKVVYKDLCNKPDEIGGTVYTGPNEKRYKQGYCQANKDGITRYSEDFCETPTGKQTLNEKKWNSQYCGVNRKSEKARFSDICDDGNGPSKDSYQGGYCRFGKNNKSEYSTETCTDGGKPNDGAWAAEYCGLEDDTLAETTVLKNACDDGYGPNSDRVDGGYCAADAKGITSYSDDFCGDGSKPNEKTWKTEYCGYADANATTTVTQTGVCDDGQGPNQERFGAGYCQGQEATGKTALSSQTCGDNNAKYNEGAWKGEYCFLGDNKVAACTGGRKANDATNSTDPFSIRCEFWNGFLCSENNLIACDKDGCEHLSKNGSLVWDENAYLCKTSGRQPK